MPDRSIHIATFEIIFHEHDASSFFENQHLWSKASFFERLDELLSSLRLHLKHKYIPTDRIEFFLIIGINSDIFRKEFRMVFGRNRYISTRKKIPGTRGDISRAYLSEDIEKWILKLTILIMKDASCQTK